MQATVETFYPHSLSGNVLLDDGVRVPFTSEALEGTRLRSLRPGQRVQVTVEGDVVVALNILTLH